jgi:hypothetical protein
MNERAADIASRKRPSLIVSAGETSFKPIWVAINRRS